MNCDMAPPKVMVRTTIMMTLSTMGSTRLSYGPSIFILQRAKREPKLPRNSKQALSGSCTHEATHISISPRSRKLYAA